MHVAGSRSGCSPAASGKEVIASLTRRTEPADEEGVGGREMDGRLEVTSLSQDTLSGSGKECRV